MIKFPKIGQFRQTIKLVRAKASYRGKDADGEAIYDSAAEMPVLPFRGTVKLHGTNAGVVLLPDGTLQAQSRNRDLTLTSDNAGFAMFVEKNREVFQQLFKDLMWLPQTKPVILYGEWCGGGIQKGVGINELEKMFVAIGLRVGDDEDTRYLDFSNTADWGLDEERIFSIYDKRFPVKLKVIDFNKPGLSQTFLTEVTETVEAECPVAKAFGVSGVGEGVVWTCVSDDPLYNDTGLWFKVKGERHSASKVKTLAKVDVEKVKSIHEFADLVTTEVRCRQGIEHLRECGATEFDRSQTGDYLRWIVGDVMAEEVDTLIAAKLEPKDVNKHISERARRWFFDQIDSGALEVA